jgi:hypothetical protein
VKYWFTFPITAFMGRVAMTTPSFVAISYAEGGTMKRHISQIVIISLAAPFSFTALKTPRLTQAAVALLPQHPQVHRAKDVPESCPVTKPPAHAFVPPSPYLGDSSPDGFWFGGEKLWTLLPTDGTWKELPHYRPTDTAFRNKLFWWREG